MTVTAVHFGSVPATSFNVVNDTTITAVAPAGLTGVQNVRVTKTPGGQSAISATFDFGAALSAPVWTSPATANATEGVAFSYTATATGNPAPTFSVVGALPGWASFASPATVSGTPPAGSAGSASFTLQASNSQGSPQRTVNVTIAAGAPALTAPVITSPNTASATEGQAFSYTITASGNPAPAVATGFNATGLPGWLTRANNVVSGTPPAGSGNSSINFTVTATNSEGTSPGVLVTVNIAEPAAGWEVTYTFPGNIVVILPPTNKIPFTSFAGWNPAFAADVTEDLYDFPNQASLPVQLYAKIGTDIERQVPFDNWGFDQSTPNRVFSWGVDDSQVPPGIYITGSNSSSQPIALRLVKA